MAKVEEITPYGSDDPKGRQVEQMFDSIAPAYDLGIAEEMTTGPIDDDADDSMVAAE